MANPLDGVIRALFTDVDTDAALAVLKELHLPVAYSDDSVGRINAEADKLADKAAKLKQSEAPRSKRKAVREEVDRLVNARAFLYRIRPAQPGDVTAEIGGKS